MEQWLAHGLPALAARLLEVRHRCVPAGGTQRRSSTPDTCWACRPRHVLHAWAGLLPARSPMLMHRLTKGARAGLGPALAAQLAAYAAAQEQGFQVSRP